MDRLTELTKSRWLIFSFFRNLYLSVVDIWADYRDLSRKVAKLESDRVADLSLIADLTDRLNSINITVAEVLPKLTPDQTQPKSLSRHPTELMDSIYRAYNSTGKKVNEEK